MKRKKYVVTIIIGLLLIITSAVTIGAESRYRFYKRLIKRNKIGVIREYYTDELTGDMIVNRKDDIIVEKIIGTVINKKKDGKIMNVPKGCGSYISYGCVKGAKKGDVILTICIYTPGNSAEDDICERFDYIIDRK